MDESPNVTDLPFLSEIFKIVEGALRLDSTKVRNYAQLLAEKLDANGDQPSARRLRRMLEEPGNQLRPLRMEQTALPPVDGESRFPLLERVNSRGWEASVVLTDMQAAMVGEFVDIVKHRAALDDLGLGGTPSLLLYGPPGCGKTHLAVDIARRLDLPIFVARLDGLISSFLGSTAKNIRAIFEFAARTPCILFLDEFDAIAKVRDDQQELGTKTRSQQFHPNTGYVLSRFDCHRGDEPSAAFGFCRMAAVRVSIGGRSSGRRHTRTPVAAICRARGFFEARSRNSNRPLRGTPRRGDQGGGGSN
jgi:hypothetical protein